MASLDRSRREDRISPSDPPASFLGEEIYRTRDEQGWILVYQKGELRTLSFGSRDEQSGMLLSQPEQLEYAYTQAMMLSLLLAPQPRRLAVLGLGGGSLVRALLHVLPHSSVTAVESRSEVARIARSYFSLPSTPRLRVVIADAGDYLRQKGPPWDLVLTDLFVQSGMDPQQTDTDFLDACKARLGPRGVLAMNLWNTDYRESRHNRERLMAAFDDRVLHITVSGGNSVAFAFAGEIPALARRPFFAAAQDLGLALGIPLQRMARSLWLQNALRIRCTGSAGGN